MDPLGTNMYLLKRYRPSDSFCTFISESVLVNWTGVDHCLGQYIIQNIVINKL